MKDERKTKRQLLAELTELRQRLAEANHRVAELETSTAEHTRAEERDRALYEFSPDGVVTVELDGRITECNRAYAEMLGYSREELEGLKYQDVMPARWHDFYERIRKEVMERGYSYEFEKEYAKKDGMVFPVSLRTWRIDDESGRPVGVWSIARDITGRKRVEEELRRYSERLEDLVEDKTRTLRESGENFRSLAENANDGILISIATEGTYVYANKRAAEMTGYSVDELLKSCIEDLAHPDEFKKTMSRYRKRLAGEDVPRQYEAIFIRKDGKSMPIELTAAQTTWHGQPAALIIIRDIAERKQAEEALQKSEREKAVILGNMLENVVYQDPDMRILWANRAAGESVGLSSEQLVGRYCYEIWNQRGEPCVGCPVIKARESGQPQETEMTTPDGRMWLVRGYPIHDADGKITAVVEVTMDITERKRAEEALRESEEMYKMLVEASPESVTATDLEGHIIYVSQRALELHGAERAEELLGKAAFDLIAPEEREKAAANLRRTLEEGVVRNIEYTLLRKDGSRFSGELNAALVKDAQGKPKAFIATVRDITDRKRAEEALELRVKQLAALTQASQAVTASLELDQVLAEIVSLASEVMASDYTSVVLVDEAGHLGESVDNVPGVPAIEYRIREDGLTKWIVRSRQAAIIDKVEEDGTITPHLGEGAPRFANPPVVAAGVKSLAGLPLMVRDRLLGVLYLHSLCPGAFEGQLPLLTAFANQAAIAVENARLYESVQRELEERVQTEEALRESEERYRAIFEQAADSIVLVDAETGALVEFNDRTHENLGYTREEFEKLKLSDFEVVESAEEAARHIEQVVGEGSDTFETKQRTKSGEVREILISARGISVRGRDFVQGIWRDITEHKRLEEQVRMQERLAAVGQLAGGIAHDFNNFLTTIMLYAQILLRKPSLPSELAPIAGTILEESRRAAQLVRRVLDFSRRSIIETCLVNLASFIDETADILRRTLPENIKLLIDVGSEEYVVSADPTCIQQVVMNLALNARDAMPDGGELRVGLSRVTVRPGTEPPAAEMACGAWVCLAISDTGTGMTEEVQAHLFEPFFTTKGPNGTGLGLAQVYGIVKQHGGTIKVETRVEQGTTFLVYLPAHNVAEQQRALEMTSALPQGQGECVLLVEDEERVREVGQEMLELLGYRVLTAANGQEALEVYRSAGEIDLVITDMVMPEMGGKELVEALRRIAPHVRVLAITGYALAEDIEGLRRAGIRNVVQKPLESDVLARIVRQALDTD
jgi:two-component system cell cycle sensor histidine kinase/response regulator CckA